MHRCHSPYLSYMRLSNSMLQPRWNPAVLDKNRLFYALWTTGLFLLLIWGVYGINEVYGMNWRRLGNHPREWNHVGGSLYLSIFTWRLRPYLEQYHYIFHAEFPPLLLLPIHCLAHMGSVVLDFGFWALDLR